MRLLYYVEEKVRFPDAYGEELSEEKASLFYEKLRRHYKIRQFLVFRGTNGSGNCNRNKIRLSRNATVGVLAHEVAHAIQFKSVPLGQAKGKRWHTKKHTKIMERVINYINKNRESWLVVEEKKSERRMQSFQNKRERDVRVKEYKKSDAYKIDLLLASEKRLTTKKKRIDTLLKKVQKKIKYYSKKGVVVGTGQV